MLPKLGENASTMHYDYAVSNPPEAMLLDASLLNNLNKEIEWHITCTSCLFYDGPHKFSLSTPLCASSGFRQV